MRSGCCFVLLLFLPLLLLLAVGASQLTVAKYLRIGTEYAISHCVGGEQLLVACCLTVQVAVTIIGRIL
jgi:hypothetical protein